MKKITLKKISVSIFILALSAVPAAVFGAGLDTVKEGLDLSASTAGISTDSPDLATILGNLINYLFGIIAVVFLTITLVGGYLWMTAGGNEENMKKAKSFIINGINGMIVIFLAYALVYSILFALNMAIGGK